MVSLNFLLRIFMIINELCAESETIRRVVAILVLHSWIQADADPLTEVEGNRLECVLLILLKFHQNTYDFH